MAFKKSIAIRGTMQKLSYDMFAADGQLTQQAQRVLENWLSEMAAEKLS
jgi:hypothetical protein